MLTLLLAVLALALTQGPTPATSSEPDIAVISARLGPCAADFTVADVDGKGIYAATIHVRIRYGFLGIKRMDLEVGTNGAGKARVEGLPDDARPLIYTITKDELKATVEQNLSTTCDAKYEVALK